MRPRTMISPISYTFSALFLCLALGKFCLAEKITAELAAFDSVSICAPINVLLVPSKDGSSRVVTEADKAAVASIRATVTGGLLSIESTDSLQAEGNVRVTVSLPATALRALEVRSMSGVYLAPGFTSEDLSLTAGQLGGSIAASQLTAKQLSITAAGVAKVTVVGALGGVSVDAEGASSVHLAGLEGKATLSLSGLPEVAIVAKDAGASIVGFSIGTRVLYNQGTCSLKGWEGGGPLCKVDTGLKISAAPLRWTCDASITGSNMCQTSGSSASAFSSTGSSECAVMTWKGAEKAAKKTPTSTRRLRATTISSVSRTSSTSGLLPTSYTYSTTSTGSDGEPSITSCSFVNNKGGCQVNGTPVPVQQFGGDFQPAPAPAPLPEEDPLAAEAIEEITASANVASSISSATATSSGGTSCVFVNGIGGCQTG